LFWFTAFLSILFWSTIFSDCFSGSFCSCLILLSDLTDGSAILCRRFVQAIPLELFISFHQFKLEEDFYDLSGNW
jgi:hypothetical protein